MNILFISSEAAPFAKTGGLADVSGVMPRALAGSEEVALMIPGYGTENIRRAKAAVVDEFPVHVGPGTYPASIKKAIVAADFPVFFVGNDHFFGREFLYGDGSGDYADNFFRFLFFQKAALEFVRRNDLRFDIVHCNDWQTAMIPLYMKTGAEAEFFRQAKAVFAIHNLGYQGVFDADSFGATDLPPHFFSLEYLEFYGKLNCMKAGIIFSDRLVTVSPTYAKEILLPEKGFGLDGLLRKHAHKLAGILNGVDYGQWDPAGDPLIKHKYTVGSMEGKKKNKRELFARLGIVQDVQVPLLIMISRISEQKGMDLLLRLLPLLLLEDLHFVFLGVGDRGWTEKIQKVAGRYPQRLTFLNRFDEGMAHRLQAAADVLFMPSAYEPCGLNQIYAMKYGTVPLVRATGGLEDSVQEFDPATRRGTGFKFAGDDIDGVLLAVRKVLRCFSDRPLWRQVQKNGMKMDFSWERVVPEYLQLYKATLKEDVQNG
jgi:starch synthase